MPVFNNMLAGASGGAGGAGYEIERSLRFNSGDSAYLNRTPSAAGNLKTWTLSFWMKRTSFPTDGTQDGYIFNSSNTGNNNHSMMRFQGQDVHQLHLYLYEFSSEYGAWEVKTARKYRDPSAWYHIVVAMDTTQSTAADRLKIYTNGVRETEFATSSYPAQNQNAGQWNSGFLQSIGKPTYGGGTLNAYLADVHFIDGQALAPTDFGETDTNGVWQAKDTSGLTFGTNGFHLDFADNSSNAALGTDTSGNSNTWTVNNLSAGASGPNYTSGLSYVGFSGTTTFGGSAPGGVGAFDSSETSRLTGDTSSGGSQTAIYTWVPPGGSISASSFKLKLQYFGTNSFGTASVSVNGGSYYTQSGSTAITTYDFSSLITGGQITQVKFKWVANQPNIGAHAWYAMYIDNVLLVDADPTGSDSLVDTPTNGTQTDTGAGGEVVGNYATLNPLAKSSGVTLSNGNLDASVGGDPSKVLSTIGMTSGKYYAEFTVSSGSVNPGLATSATNLGIGFLGNDGGSWCYGSNGKKYHNDPGASGATYGATYTTGDVIGVAFDADNGSLTFYKNGATQGAAYTGLTSGPYFIAAGGSNSSYSTNFGQRAFAYAAPSGYKALCTANLPEPTIADGSTAMDVALYTGNGTSGRSITGLNFSPDLVWIKVRSQAYQHNLWDAVRGAGSTKNLSSNLTDAEGTSSNPASLYGYVSALNSDGFTLTTGSSNIGYVNGSGESYVAWTWDAGSSNTTIAAGSISSGVPSIASTVRANPSAGFSIVRYVSTGAAATIGHGLNASPSIVFFKPTSSSGDWYAFNTIVDGSLDYLVLNTTAAKSNSTWSNLLTSTSVLEMEGSSNAINSSGVTYIAYCFAPVEGYSAMGSYTGNGSADGPFVFTGFRPKWLMVKEASASSDPGHWMIIDTERSPSNQADNRLHADLADAEYTNNGPDMLSNGFKLRNASAIGNFSGTTYIYMAFAENPFKTARAR